MNLEQLLAECRKLPHQERARFVLTLVRELEDDEGDGEDDVHAAWTEELTRRVDEVRSGAVQPLTVDEFRQRVKERRQAPSR